MTAPHATAADDATPASLSRSIEYDEDDESESESESDDDAADGEDALTVPPDELARRCRWIVTHQRFEGCILGCILMNCVLLALDRPASDAQPPLWMAALDAALAAIYVCELALKLGAWRAAFWRETKEDGGADWRKPHTLNCVDAAVALEGAFSAVVWAMHHAEGAQTDDDEGGDGGGAGLDLAVLRIVRLVRPLRTLNRFPSVRVVVDALARSARGLSAILVMLGACHLGLFDCSARLDRRYPRSM